MEMFFNVVSFLWLLRRYANAWFHQEMLDKAADPSYYQYRGQPGVIDIDHLELVALKRVAKSSYMPHFRLITPQPQKQ